MKKIILNLTIISFLIIICNSAMAVYIDTPLNIGLLHCDTTVTSYWGAPNTNSYWLLTPDDNSSGRDACTPVLNMTNNFSSFTVMDPTTIPTFKPDSPYGGDYMHFNGLTDSVYVAGGWLGDNSVELDFSFRWLGLPDASEGGDNYMGLVWAYPWKCYLMNRGDGEHGYINMLLWTGAPEWFQSQSLSSNVWYDVNFRLYEKNMTLIIGNVSEGYTTNTGMLVGDINQTATQVIIGSDNFVPTRLFNGDMDEIKWGYVIPEPMGIWIIGMLVFFIKGGTR